LLLLHSVTCHPRFIKGAGQARQGLNVGGPKWAGPNRFWQPVGQAGPKINGPGLEYGTRAGIQWRRWKMLI